MPKLPLYLMIKGALHIFLTLNMIKGALHMSITLKMAVDEANRSRMVLKLSLNHCHPNSRLEELAAMVMKTMLKGMVVRGGEGG